MKDLKTIPEYGKQNERMGPEMKHDFVSTTLNIKVSHGLKLNDHEVTVSSNSSFGNLKSHIVQKIGLNSETHKLFFRGKEKDDDEDLRTTGVKDYGEVLHMEDITSRQRNTEEVQQTNVISRGGEAVAEIRTEVDMLAGQVSALQAVVDSGIKVDNKDVLYVTEMLMRQLLKLDGIDAEGEGKVQRKLEVRRVQSLVDTMDLIKSRNSNPFFNGDQTESLTNQWETFEPEYGCASAPSLVSSHTPNHTLLSTPTHVSVSTHTHTSVHVSSQTPTHVSVSSHTVTSVPVSSRARARARARARVPVTSDTPTLSLCRLIPLSLCRLWPFHLCHT